MARLARSLEADAKAPSRCDHMPVSRTILVVDDEKGVRDSLQDFLQLSGFTVVVAANGYEALEILNSQRPDLIVADIMMPRMNGYQFYHRVRENPEWTWIPFIFLTAKGEAEDIRFGKELGADDYLQKPIEPEDLMAAVLGRLKRYQDLDTRPGIVDAPMSHSDDTLPTIEPLTKRELEVLGFMVEGYSNREIASELVIGPATVKSHVSNILSKMGVSNRVEAVSIALQRGLLAK